MARPNEFSRATMQAALARQKYCCACCGTRITALGQAGQAQHTYGEVAHAHHMRHIKLGGTADVGNCVILCWSCHYSAHEGGGYRRSLIETCVEDYDFFNGNPTMNVTIYHNPLCSNSRQALAVIREHGIEPAVVEYLKTPLSVDQIKLLMFHLGVPIKDVVRFKEAAAAEAGISESSSDEALLLAMAKFPILMNRPIVTSDKGAKLCRPGDEVKSLL